VLLLLTLFALGEVVGVVLEVGEVLGMTIVILGGEVLKLARGEVDVVLLVIVEGMETVTVGMELVFCVRLGGEASPGGIWTSIPGRAGMVIVGTNIDGCRG